MTHPVATLDEIRGLLGELPGPDLDAASEAARRNAAFGAGALGRLGEAAQWLATWQAKHPPRLEHPRVALFAASHGAAARLGMVPGATAQRVARCVEGNAPVNDLCRSIDADLRLYEMALDQPTTDFTEAPAMGEEDCTRAMAYGMMAVEPGIDLLVLGVMADGSEIAAAALAALLFGGAAEDWSEGPGVAAVAAALARHRNEADDPFDALRRVGGTELAALAGAVMAARLAHVPVVLDGFAATAAAAATFAADRRALDHCRIADATAGPARRLAGLIGQAPLLELGLPNGEGVAGTVAVAVLKAALACHNGMASSE
jgi:nicotinate-nucleotide--dimethylbenzimidazole phosphoribosyltransferase